MEFLRELQIVKSFLKKIIINLSLIYGGSCFYFVLRDFSLRKKHGVAQELCTL